VPPDRREERQAALRLSLEQEGLDGLLITHLPNIRYLTGFTGSAALLLIRAGSTVLVSDYRYAAQAPAEVGSSASVEIDQKNVWDRLGRVLAESPGETLGVEACGAAERAHPAASGADQ
jgi:Xaa-Pro aminopeptidase